MTASFTRRGLTPTLQPRRLTLASSTDGCKRVSPRAACGQQFGPIDCAVRIFGSSPNEPAERGEQRAGNNQQHGENSMLAAASRARFLRRMHSPTGRPMFCCHARRIRQPASRTTDPRGAVLWPAGCARGILQGDRPIRSGDPVAPEVYEERRRPIPEAWRYSCVSFSPEFFANDSSDRVGIDTVFRLF